MKLSSWHDTILLLHYSFLHITPLLAHYTVWCHDWSCVATAILPGTWDCGMVLITSRKHWSAAYTNSKSSTFCRMCASVTMKHMSPADLVKQPDVEVRYFHINQGSDIGRLLLIGIKFLKHFQWNILQQPFRLCEGRLFSLFGTLHDYLVWVRRLDWQPVTACAHKVVRYKIILDMSWLDFICAMQVQSTSP